MSFCVSCVLLLGACGSSVCVTLVCVCSDALSRGREEALLLASFESVASEGACFGTGSPASVAPVFVLLPLLSWSLFIVF